MPLLSKHVRAVCFDAVGTLIFPDPPAHRVYAEVGGRFGCRLDVETIRTRFRDAFAAEERRDFEEGLRTNEERERERWRQIVATVLADATDPEECFHELYQHFARPQAWRCAAHTGRVLAELARTRPVALASNYDRRLRHVAAGLPQLAAVSRLIISSEVGWRKPAAPFFEAVARALELSPEQILFVGDDTVNDYDGANAAGLEVVLFDPAEAGPAGVRRIRDLRELLEEGDAR